MKKAFLLKKQAKTERNPLNHPKNAKNTEVKSVGYKLIPMVDIPNLQSLFFRSNVFRVPDDDVNGSARQERGGTDMKH